jgi:hypothetical protein
MLNGTNLAFPSSRRSEHRNFHLPKSREQASGGGTNLRQQTIDHFQPEVVEYDRRILGIASGPISNSPHVFQRTPYLSAILHVRDIPIPHLPEMPVWTRMAIGKRFREGREEVVASALV